MKVSEIFYSIQGEGPTTGAPSIFLRLTGCNLMCGGHGGKLVKQGKATWHCDTEKVWRSGVQMEVEEIADKIEALVGSPEIKYHLVITGGEPMLPTHSASLDLLLNEMFMRQREPHFIEVETNGTLPICPILLKKAHQFNVSPKLANSGMDRKYRITTSFVDYADNLRSVFKFVVGSVRDVEEVYDDFVDAHDIDLSRCYLMPTAGTRQEAEKVGRVVAELAKEYGFRYSHRLHLTLWDQTTGV